ncbi:MAG: hypothetical protein GF311_11685 [Candidatus Lokiarchaeota archaeon]|nr:hypothetical protein [Candidatus Lokiarchaeota archaeon]
MSLVTIDHHLDITIDLDDTILELIEELTKTERKNELVKNLNDLREILEKNSRKDNVSFIQLGFELNLIDKAVIITPTDDPHRLNHLSDYEIYHPKCCLGNFLMQSNRPSQFIDEYDEDLKNSINIIKKRSYILDMDLDYFTYTKENKNFPDSQQYFEFLLQNNFNSLINNAKLITIALEPNCCGGIKNVSEILYSLTEIIEKYYDF